jgi:hypothetical protein
MVIVISSVVIHVQLTQWHNLPSYSVIFKVNFAAVHFPWKPYICISSSILFHILEAATNKSDCSDRKLRF